MFNYQCMQSKRNVLSNFLTKIPSLITALNFSSVFFFNASRKEGWSLSLSNREILHSENCNIYSLNFNLIPICKKLSIVMTPILLVEHAGSLKGIEVKNLNLNLLFWEQVEWNPAGSYVFKAVETPA